MTIPVGISLLSVVTYGVAFFIDKPVQFSYAHTTCLRQLTLLPDLHKTTVDSGFSVETKNYLTVAGTRLVSLQSCFTPKHAPQTGITKVGFAPFGSWFAKKTFAVKIAEPPTAHTDVLSRPIPTAKVLPIKLSSPDNVYDYQLEIDKKIASCSSKGATIYCDIVPLGLVQDKNYSLKLIRSFKGTKIATIANEKIITLKATTIAKSSLSEGQVLYDKPKSFTFEFDKAILRASVRLLKVEGETRTEVAATSTIKDTQAILTLTDELARDASYELTIDTLEAKDGSTLVSPYIVRFKASGGPKVTGVNIGTSGIALSQTITLTLDQALSDTQDITKFVSVKGIDVLISKKDNQVFLTYKGASKCTDFTITVAKGLTSKYDIAQSEPWSFTSRTICHSVSTIGYSREGRPINAYTFGSGARPILFMGTIHGSEKSSKYIMDSLIADLEARAREIPADRQVVIIPVVSPDGFATYGRKNAAGVNLNRNFPTYNWTSDTEVAPGQVEQGAGGPSALSEPETQALANFTLQLGAQFVATFHAQGSLVNSNDVGSALNLSQEYARLTGYRYISNEATTGTFGFVVTGTYEDWLLERGIPGILIELPTVSGNFFTQNKGAVWAMIKNF